jgi:hypothetical protein
LPRIKINPGPEIKRWSIPTTLVGGKQDPGATKTVIQWCRINPVPSEDDPAKHYVVISSEIG